MSFILGVKWVTEIKVGPLIFVIYLRDTSNFDS
jgi:hypothetical protein